MTALGELQQLLHTIETRRGTLDRIRQHWEGRSPAAFLSKESRDALEDRVSRLSVNFPALAVRSMADRLKLRGFRTGGAQGLDDRAGRLMRQTDLHNVAELVHTDRQLYGAAYCTVWTTADGTRPVTLADSPFTAAAAIDPATGETTAAVRTWRTRGQAHAALFTPDTVRRYVADVADGGDILTATTWREAVGQSVDNVLGVVPVVPFIRRAHSADYAGTSAVADILDLSDAVAKALADAMVNSEYYAKPRRWATGLEIEEDADGNPVDPFGPSRFLQSESPDTKFGQLQPAAPTGQTDLVATLTQQIGALMGLPPHYLGLHGDQPANADSVRAAEAQLVSAAYSELRQLSHPWATVGALLLAIDSETDPDDYDVATEFESPEIKTPSQAADAAVKLRDIGVPLRNLLSHPLDYEPHEVDAIMSEHDRVAVQQAALNLGRMTP